MKVPLEWLQEHIDIKLPIDEFSNRLTMAGLEVEAIDHVSPVEVRKQGGEGIGTEDRVLVTTVTPNRGDWLSIIGVAREAAAVTDEQRKNVTPIVEGTGSPASDAIKIDIRDPDLCHRYVGMVIRNVTIKESPGWMKDRLIRAGMRPINNIVDITNYVMLEYGQPLHAFDYDLLHGSQIIVRRAKDGEQIVSIDDVTRELRPDMLVIADADRPVAIAGVMGGFDSEVTANTKTIMLESAHFDAVSIRRTSKTLGMVTESSYRFERSVDPRITDAAAMRAAELMRDLANGEIAAGMVDVHPTPPTEIVIKVRPDRVNRILGTELALDNMAELLCRLEMKAEVGSELKVVAPTFRPDVTTEIDVIEEIGRMYGYENIGCTLPPSTSQGADSVAGAFAERMRQIAMACGSQEVVTHSLVDPVLAEIAGKIETEVFVRNPLSEDTRSVRTMLAPNLLQVIARNQAFGLRDMSIFEVGRVFFRNSEDQPDEYNSMAMAMVGSQWESAWNLDSKALDADFYLCKGALESILDRLVVKDVKFVPEENALLHPARAAGIYIGAIKIGVIGEVSAQALEKLGIRGRPCVFELDMDVLLELVPETREYQEPSRFPGLRRDIAVVTKKNISYAEIESTARKAGGDVVAEVELRDVYTGAHIGEDERSITLSLLLRSTERTLTDEEANDTLDQIKTVLAEQLGASFRA